jgi:hypothetical protein
MDYSDLKSYPKAWFLLLVVLSALFLLFEKVPDPVKAESISCISPEHKASINYKDANPRSFRYISIDDNIRQFKDIHITGGRTW